MGDYNVQIISAKFKTMSEQERNEFKQKFESEFGRTTSAYHATAPFVQWDDFCGLVVSAIAQVKYNRGMDEFLNWLKPFVIQGMGVCDAWAINFSEYSKEPEILYLAENEPEY